MEDTRLEAKDTKKSKAKDSLSEDRHSRGQGHKRKCSPKKRSSQKFFKRSPQKNVFKKIFQALHKILTIQKIVLSSSRGQANLQGLEASRPRTSKCVLEAKDVLKDSTSVKQLLSIVRILSACGFFQ